MDNKTVIGFEVTEEKKKEIIGACKKFKIDKISVPLKVSQFIRMAVDRLLDEALRRD